MVILRAYGIYLQYYKNMRTIFQIRFFYINAAHIIHLKVTEWFLIYLHFFAICAKKKLYFNLVLSDRFFNRVYAKHDRESLLNNKAHWFCRHSFKKELLSPLSLDNSIWCNDTV